MKLVTRRPDRAQLGKFIPDQQAVRAFEELFGVYTLLPGDIVYRAATTRRGALLCGGQAVSRTLYPDLFKAIVPVALVTITIASPGVITWTAHGLAANTKIQFSTTGALPTGLVAGTVYFVKTVIGVNTFSVSATAGGAAINTSGSQSGKHTATAFPYGNGDGSTTFEVPTVPAVGTAPGTSNAFIVF
jgi:hypothetical protein